jgi:hypothetical protein
MPVRIWLFALLLLAPGLAAAQPVATPPPSAEAIRACHHVPPSFGAARQAQAAGITEVNPPSVYRAFMRYRESLNYDPTVPVEKVSLNARWARQHIEILVPFAGKDVFYTVFMVPREAMNRPRSGEIGVDGALRAQVTIAERTEDTGPTRLLVSYERPTFYTFTHWRAFVLPCEPAGDRPYAARAFGEQDVLLTGRVFAALLGLGAAALILFVLGMASYRVNGWQFAPPPEHPERRASFFARFNPVFICQDAFGTASLARFQVLLFTVVLLGVYAYAFAAAQEAPTVSASVLALAGITLAGSTVAAAASKPSLEPANRMWLYGTGVIPRVRRTPVWTDLIASEGEVDITRMQALGFSLFAAVAVVFQGAQDLGSFTIPEQLNYLIGLSQAVYIAGKALPVDSLKRLNADLDALRTAERTAINKPEDSPEYLDFMRLKTGIAVSLTDVFGDGLRRAVLLELKPGERMGGAAPA